MSFDESWNKNVYSLGKSINKYPYGELVSIFFNSLKFLPENKLQNKKDIKVLEIGCGAGNNLWFVDENGFDTYGIDGSEIVCEYAKKNLLDRNSNAQVKQAYFNDLPFDDNSIDIIFDREATCCGTLDDIKESWNEANRVLKKGGVVISFLFSDDSPYCIKANNNECINTKLENNTFTDYEEGAFAGLGKVHFTSYEEISEIFHFCNIKFINKHNNETIYDTSNNDFNYKEWIIVGVKK
ncbi:MAG: class I SAM-dependent methyltransferase [Campylobacterota bacterium]|nr:class I SAM-dependent methyltransferase [Campylobacterota bacterium]